MAIVRVCLAALILLLGGTVAWAADPDAAASSALYDRPVLVVDRSIQGCTPRRSGAPRPTGTGIGR
jgi:hypothetical protein